MIDTGTIIDYYSQFDEWGRLDREPLEFAVQLHFIQLYIQKASKILDNGAGPGKYAMELARLGHRVTLSDLTPRLVDGARRKAEELELSAAFDGFHVMDARHLEPFADASFDAALMLGPMYHLQEPADRERAVGELFRISKPGGVVFVAFMPRIFQLATALRSPELWKPLHTAQGIAGFMSSGRFDHADEGRFTGVYYTEIDEICPFMESSGFITEKMIGSGGIVNGVGLEQWDYWRNQGEQAFEQIKQHIFAAAESPYTWGASSHLMYIGRKGL